jgi:hypothetical protein
VVVEEMRRIAGSACFPSTAEMARVPRLGHGQADERVEKVRRGDDATNSPVDDGQGSDLVAA